MGGEGYEGEATMLSPRGIHHADQLRAMLDDGVLPDNGPVEMMHGTANSMALAVRIVLADIDHLAYPEVTDPGLPERWDAAEAELEALWWLAMAWGAGTVH